MVDIHDYSFFGQNTGLIVRSQRVTEPFIFLTCVRKKQDGTWEKTSQKEGKTIKVSLEEMVSFLAVFSKKFPSWKGFHRFKGEDTPIELISRDNLKSPFLIKVGPYIKPFAYAQAEIFRMLLEHMIKERIEHLNGFVKTVENEEEDDQVNRKVYVKQEMKTNMET
jgi:hypothetical protein